MVSSIIDSSVTSIPNFFSITSGDSLLVTKNGALFSPLGGYGFGGLTNVLVDCAGYINLESLGFSSGGIMTIETGGVYSGNSLTASLIFTGGVSFTNMGSASFRMDGVLSRGGNFLANTGTVTAVGTDFILNHAGTNFDQLVNDGTVISRNAYGVQVESGTANITNHGTIEALGSVNFGSNIGIYAGGNTTITNSGTITGTYAGVQSSFVSTADVTVLSNDGTITGFNYSYVGGAGLSFVYNRGLMNGDVDLGDNTDLFDGRSGTVNGNVLMGDGADTFDGRGGVINGSVFGGIGADLYFTNDAHLVISENATVGEVDQVFAATSFHLSINVENLTLLGAADYRGTGNASANVMLGNGGDNRLTGLSGNDGLSGDAGNDTLWGNFGNDTLRGDDGADHLIGGLGKDYMVGGADEDVFLFSALAQSGNTQTTADVIADFKAGEDHIDLAAIDAVRINQTSDDAFKYIGAAGFSGVSGQLRYAITAGVTYIQMDVNGDSVADSMIKLSTAVALNAADFVL